MEQRAPLVSVENKSSAQQEHIIADVDYGGTPGYTAAGLGPSTKGIDNGPINAKHERSELLALAYPAMLITTLEFLPGFTSTVLAGHLNAAKTSVYVDAVSLSNMMTTITAYSVGYGLATALDTLCSQAFGARQYSKIGIYVQSGLLVLTVCLVPVAVANYDTEPLLLYMRQDPDVSSLAEQFSRYNLLGVPCEFLFELFRKALQAQGIMSPLVVIATLDNLVDIAWGYWTAYHTNWGFEGIALARAVANCVPPLLMWVYLRWWPDHFTQWWTGWDLRGAVEHVPLFLRLGIPGMLMMMMESSAIEIMSFMAGVLPHHLVASSAHFVVLNVVCVLHPVFLGFSIAANVKVGYHLGANQPERARLVRRLAMQIVAVMGLTLGVVAFAGRMVIPRLIVANVDAITRASQVLSVWAPFQVFDALNCVLQGIFRGAGRQKVAALVNAVSFGIVGLPLSYVLAFHADWGASGLWLGYGMGMIVSSLTLIAISSTWDWHHLAHVAQFRVSD